MQSKFSIVLASLIFLLGFSACDTVPIRVNDSLDSFFEDQRRKMVQEFTFDPTVDQVIVGEQGTILRIKANIFRTRDWETPTKDLTAELIEIYDKKNMILADIVTLGRREGRQYPLVSGGEFFVRFTQDGEFVYLEESINLETQVTTRDTNMRLFNAIMFPDSTSEDLLQNTVETWYNTADSLLAYCGDTLTGNSGGYCFDFLNTASWFNCDYFSIPTSTTRNLSISLPEGYDYQNAKIYLSFPKVNSVLPVSFYSEDTWILDNISLGETIDIIVIGEKDNRLHCALEQHVIDGDLDLTINTLEKVSLTELNDLLNTLE